MQEEKLKQLELLIAQASTRLQTAKRELVAARQKIRQQEETISRLRQSEADLKALREWKRNTISTLRKLETKIDKELAKVNESQSHP